MCEVYCLPLCVDSLQSLQLFLLSSDLLSEFCFLLADGRPVVSLGHLSIDCASVRQSVNKEDVIAARNDVGGKNEATHNRRRPVVAAALRSRA